MDNDQGWTLDASCKGVANPDIWFPEMEMNSHVHERDWNWKIMLAKVVCSECPVTGKCLKWALEHNEEYGVWGGMTVNERRKLQGQRIRI